MINILPIWTLVAFITVNILTLDGIKCTVNWNGNWAFACDFHGNDMYSVRSSGEHCGGKCANTHGCTHFAWTLYNGGTCWLKSGHVSKSDAFPTGRHDMVCGVKDSPTPPVFDKGNILHGVLATRHGAHEAGACALPASNYAVINSVALGSIGSLQYIKFRPDLCGHVLKVDCGNGPLDIIITNSNYGGGLDLYGSTWGMLTNNKPPGETHCSAQLTEHYGNAYYHNVGLLNTGGRIVTGATIDNRAGEHRGDNPYYAFDFGPIDKNKQVVFTFNKGPPQFVALRDCEYTGSEQMWR
ncbi:unnamed protein product [Rotaria socialis]|uniref:Apple domain-containing protein n=1 Tax=Rotaria socialis TaxID=392032 RepID=A0A820TUW2_9BILA|nr:unnamed protein product [Rotaria socialis]